LSARHEAAGSLLVFALLMFAAGYIAGHIAATNAPDLGGEAR
jgi:hypothetical protein